MKFAEASLLESELLNKQRARMDHTDTNNVFIIGYEKGMEDIIRILCDRKVIDNSDDIKRESEGGY